MTVPNGQSKRDASKGGCSWAFAADSSLRELLPVATGSKDEDGTVRRRYSKDLIQVGTYVHPVQGWTLDVTRDRLDEWAATFHKMRINGVPVEVVKDHSFKAQDKIGELVDVFRDGDVLVGIHEFVGQDSIDLAKKVGTVSIWLEQNFADGKGILYGEAILHSSLVQQAIVPDQEGFVPVEVAAGRLPAAALSLSRHMESTMKPETLKKIRTLLGDDKLGEDDALLKLVERHEAMAGDKKDFDKKLSAVSEEVATLKAKNAELQKNADGEPKVDADSLEMLAEGTDEKIQAMVASAKITPAVALKLSAALVGPAEARNVRALSRKFAGGEQSLAKSILDALAENDPVKLAEQTKGQSKSLGRETPDDGPAGLDQEVVDDMIAQSGAPKASDEK